MSCEDFVTLGPWTIVETEGTVVVPFVVGNVVEVDEGLGGTFVVKVFKGGDLLLAFPGFECGGGTLNGDAGAPLEALTMQIETWDKDRKRVLGEWLGLMTHTGGTWTGNDGGG